MNQAAVLALQEACARLPGQRRFGPYNLQVRSGATVALLGPSGAGKSTLLRLMAGELAARTGQVLMDGKALHTWPAAALAQRRAVLPQSHGVAFGMPVELVVALGRISRPVDPGQASIVAEALVQAQAAHLLGRRFDTLSGGEQARVMLARVFAQLWDVPPGWLLVDEPLAALDPGLQLDLTEALADFCSSRGHALVAVLHDLNLALAAFDRLWLVQAGQVVADLPANAAAVPALEQLYGVGLQAVDDGQGRTAVLLRRRVPAVAPSAASTSAQAELV
jgi:iron complex transport system ATP-binding protein